MPKKGQIRGTDAALESASSAEFDGQVIAIWLLNSLIGWNKICFYALTNEFSIQEQRKKKSFGFSGVQKHCYFSAITHSPVFCVCHSLWWVYSNLKVVLFFFFPHGTELHACVFLNKGTCIKNVYSH